MFDNSALNVTATGAAAAAATADQSEKHADMTQKTILICTNLVGIGSSVTFIISADNLLANLGPDHSSSFAVDMCTRH